MSVITEKGQTTIPKPVRELLGVHPGDEVEFEVEDGLVVLHKKAWELPFQRWRGYLGKLRTKEVMDELR